MSQLTKGQVVNFKLADDPQVGVGIITRVKHGNSEYVLQSIGYHLSGQEITLPACRVIQQIDITREQIEFAKKMFKSVLGQDIQRIEIETPDDQQVELVIDGSILINGSVVEKGRPSLSSLIVWISDLMVEWTVGYIKVSPQTRWEPEDAEPVYQEDCPHKHFGDAVKAAIQLAAGMKFEAMCEGPY